MKLTKVERWILSNQYLLLQALCPRDAQVYAEARDAIDHGYEREYDELSQHILDGDEIMTVAECNEVLDILEMFRGLKFAYKNLEDKEGINESATRFAGFDGNNESKYMAYARYFCQADGGRYPELDRGDKFNSHIRMLDAYRRMLAQWRPCDKTRLLSKDEIMRITEARKPTSDS